MGQLDDTIVALATAPQAAALAVVRISGPATHRLYTEIFHKEPSPRRMSLLKYKCLKGKDLDQCLGAFYPQGASFTGDTSLELFLHGNPLIVQHILQDLLARGCRMAQGGEFTQRAFLQGRIDLTQAEAVADLIAAENATQLRLAHNQLGGALSEKIQTFQTEIIGHLATIEAHIDFPEEDLFPEDLHGLRTNLQKLCTNLQELAATHLSRQALFKKREIAILGAPNTGKSSLLNALLGEQRALVSPESATTRDSISEPLLLGRQTFRLSDTAGLGTPQSPLDARSHARTLEVAERADALIWLLDASLPASKEDEITKPPLASLLKKFAQDSRLICVLNKIDLPPRKKVPQQLAAVPCFALSAQTGEGLGALKNFLAHFLNTKETANCTILVNTRTAHALQKAHTALQKAHTALQKPSQECAAFELRAAMDHLSSILGLNNTENENILNQLFTHFCIGK